MRKHAAFTLIDLLVVMAIIALLAAILFPVFAQVREKARGISCLSNMKQIGAAEKMYMQDYDGGMHELQRGGRHLGRGRAKPAHPSGTLFAGVLPLNRIASCSFQKRKQEAI